MPLVLEKSIEHIGETKAAANHDRDMIHELSKRIDAVWHADQYIANAETDKELKQFWTDLKSQELENVKKLKKLVTRHIGKDCF
jgi:hypothetical protein